MLVQSSLIELLADRQTAEEISEFLLSDSSFDDTHYTPGELKHFRELPYRALQGDCTFWFARNEHGKIAGINCIAQNEQGTGGYNWDYLVVHKDYRRSGLAARFIEEMFRYLQEQDARYIVTYTCDLPEYAAIQRMFLKLGFSLVGRCPDYYYDGEDRLIYHRKLI
ncbi:GNAT family N-acetyltransferase [Paenibacillus sp. LHD-117]|uniref:GNAT family N-acetyltransferase n=1 Tax=Paenibacillus sp. LHD-117 TaxID=3071412 RepID=UPI0027E12332|nr:GNAT family N-acetyltransferase [Paenibacillus sp. LHD-117]MDQ6423025.1 GNAT family N-acetyltransferase [Paenibacillus sp. LHD-117]